jgi:CBS domain-containing protein
MHTIRELITVPPRIVGPADSVVEAAKLMKGEESGFAPIVESGRLVGVVTDRDIVVKVIAESRDPETTRVEEIGSTRLVTIDPDQDAAEALRLMAAHGVWRLPVVEEDGRLVGIVACEDVERLAATEDELHLVSQFAE